MEPVRISPWVMLRAALAIGLPAAVGLALGQSAGAALVSLGALPAITGDSGGPYRVRAQSIGWTVLGGALGYLLGALLHGYGWWTVGGSMALVLVASLIGTFNNVAAVATLQFAVYVIVGASLSVPMPAWVPSALVGAGGIFGLALTLSGWLFNPTAPERATVALLYRRLASLLDTIGTSRTITARRDMEAAVSNAYDTLLSARNAAGASRRLSRLAAQMQATTPLINETLALARAGRVLPRECGQCLNRLAEQVEADAPIDTHADAARLRTLGVEGLAEALDQAQPLLAGTHADSKDVLATLGPARPRTPWRVLWQTYQPGATATRYLIRLALCLIVAEGVSLSIALPRSYWVPLIVIVVFKPNFGSVFARAVQSCIGSLVGVAISAAVLAIDRSGIISLVTVFLLASLLPWSIRRNYGLFSAILLPILMLLIGALQPGSWPIALARLMDVSIAGAIVLLVGYLPWIRFERGNLDRTVAGSMQTIAAYLSAVFKAEYTARHSLRTRTYSKLSDLRIALQRALSEPRLVSRRALAWWPIEVALEQVANAISDTAWSLSDEAIGPTEIEIAQLAGALHALALSVEHGTPPTSEPITTASPMLQDIAAAIEAVRSALTGPAFTPTSRQTPAPASS